MPLTAVLLDRASRTEAEPVAAPVAAQKPLRIRDDSQALEIAHELAADFGRDAAARDRERRLPWAELERFTASGLWAITVPREQGGAGVSLRTLAVVIAIVSAADGSLGQIPQNHYYALEVLRVGGTEAQKSFFYRRVLEGERFGNALAEIGHKDFKRRTRLHEKGGSLQIDGQKFYCTGALFAHWIPTLVVAQEGEREVTKLAFVPRRAEGVSIVDDWDGFGQRVTGSGSVRFEGVQIDPAWVIPFLASFERPTTIGPFAQLLHAAIDLGIGRGAFEATLPFVRERARPWIDAGVERASEDPLAIQLTGEVAVRLRAAEARVLSTTASLDAGNRLFELAGTGATLDGLGLDRFWRNARTHTLHDPVRWKYHHIGNYYLNDRLPPRHGAL